MTTGEEDVPLAADGITDRTKMRTYLIASAVCLFLLASCNTNKQPPKTKNLQKKSASIPAKEKKMTVKKGDIVEVTYTGTLKDGKIFDSSKDRKPLKFKVGDGKLLPDFEDAVIGMTLNEEKKFTIPAKRAYGEKDPKLVRTFPRSFLPADFKGKKGMSITLRSKTGRRIPAVIDSINSKSVVLDLNHPLAGKDLTFDIKVVNIEEPQ